MLLPIVMSLAALLGMIVFGLGLSRALSVEKGWLILTCGILLFLSTFSLMASIVEVFSHRTP